MGYDPYDYDDLGEFDQKGPIKTWFGSKQELLDLIEVTHAHDLSVVADMVINHNSGADSEEMNPIAGRSRIIQALFSAHRQADLVIVSAHVGPNWGAPSRAIQALAHDLIEMGADLYWSHSSHTPQGIELYKGKAILYSTSEFVDDYWVNTDERNDLSFLFMLEADAGRLRRIRLHSVRIEDLAVRLADEGEWQFLMRTMQAKCRAFGTAMEVEGQTGTINVQ